MTQKLLSFNTPGEHYVHLNATGKAVTHELPRKNDFPEDVENTTSVGDVDIVITYSDGRPSEVREYRNTILLTGRNALARSLTFDIGDSYEFYIARMIFGNGGTQNGIPRFIDEGRNGLFGLTVASKGVISTVDKNHQTQAVFTSVISFSEANNTTINEMALQMANGDLYSMRTFPDLNKDSQMQLSFSWKLSFI